MQLSEYDQVLKGFKAETQDSQCTVVDYTPYQLSKDVLYQRHPREMRCFVKKPAFVNEEPKCPPCSVTLTNGPGCAISRFSEGLMTQRRYRL